MARAGQGHKDNSKEQKHSLNRPEPQQSPLSRPEPRALHKDRNGRWNTNASETLFIKTAGNYMSVKIRLPFAYQIQSII